MNYTEVLLVLALEGSYYDSVVKDHALERKKMFCANIKVSIFVNFTVDHLKKDKKMKKSTIFCVCSCTFYLLLCIETLVVQVVCLFEKA